MPPYNPNVYVPPGVSPAVAYAIRTSGGGTMGAPPAALDLNSLYANDQMLQGQLSQIGWGADGPTGGGMLGQALAPLDESYNAALVNWGGAIPGANISATVQGLANDATRGGISTLAQLARNRMYANSYSSGQAAARGLGHSGEPGYQMGVNSLNYDVNRALEQAKVQQYLQGINQQKVGAYQTAFGQATTSANDAYDRLVQQIRDGTIADPVASYQNPNTYVPGRPVAAPRAIPGYNPRAYVPGQGRATGVPAATQQAGSLGPLNTATYNPHAYAPGQGSSSGVAGATQQQGAHPSPYLPGLAAPKQYSLTPHGRALV